LGGVEGCKWRVIEGTDLVLHQRSGIEGGGPAINKRFWPHLGHRDRRWERMPRRNDSIINAQ